MLALDPRSAPLRRKIIEIAGERQTRPLNIRHRDLTTQTFGAAEERKAEGRLLFS